MTAPSQRVPCAVPFCRRTRGLRRGDERLPPEWICGDHWRLVDRRLRRLKAKAERRERWRLAAMLWLRCKRQAIERAFGIAA